MRLTKHHGLGNDFLVLLDAGDVRPPTPDEVRALCDRRRGIGADGLIRATRPGESDAPGVVAIMQLTNADGSPAEMSGNGIRCLAQALVMAGWAPGRRLPIGTAAGLRTVTVHDGTGTTLESSVEMGVPELTGEAPEWAGGPIRRALRVDIGNPHLVLELAPGHEAAIAADTDDVRLVELGERVNAKLPDGANVHLLAPEATLDGTAAAASAGDRAGGAPERAGGVAIRTYERGVGPTLACGTGACASAAAARAWGLAGDRVRVRQPGGVAEVALDGPQAVLRGPATYVATIDVPDPGAAG